MEQAKTPIMDERSESTETNLHNVDDDLVAAITGEKRQIKSNDHHFDSCYLLDPC